MKANKLGTLMREQLKGIRGERVIIEGIIDHWRKVEGRPAYGVLITNCKVRLRSDCYALGTFNAPYITTDHLWAYFPELHFHNDMASAPLERLSTLFYAGTVIKYTRANKTKDYAVEVGETLSSRRLHRVLMSLIHKADYSNPIDISRRTDQLQAQLDILYDDSITIISDVPVDKLRTYVSGFIKHFIHEFETNYAYNIHTNSKHLFSIPRYRNNLLSNNLISTYVLPLMLQDTVGKGSMPTSFNPFSISISNAVNESNLSYNC